MIAVLCQQAYSITGFQIRQGELERNRLHIETLFYKMKYLCIITMIYVKIYSFPEGSFPASPPSLAGMASFSILTLRMRWASIA